MLFNSFVFIFTFFPILLLLYFGLNRLKLHQVAKFILVLFSLYFYAFFNTNYLWIILSSIVVNYTIGLIFDQKNMKWGGKNIEKNILLVIGILFNIGILGYYKYSDFMIENMNSLFGTNIALLKLLLPLGISFFTFQQLAFVVDRYRNQTVQPSFLDYCNFVTFFPQLIAGPIVLPEEMLPQFENKKNSIFRYENFNRGFLLFSLGLIKKVLIADSIAVFAQAGFDCMETGTMTMAEAWLSSLAYTFQLYFDFSGYCDMAMGIALCFNIKLPINFNKPYRAANFQDFWRRWHITLNRFLTHYLYIPLGGSRKGEGKTLRNIILVFLVSGIWHGAGWTYIVWGALHGAASVVNRLWKRAGRPLPNWIAVPLTFFFVNLFWVFFRADSVEKACGIIRAMFTGFQLQLTQNFTSQLPSIFPNFYNMLLFIIAIPLALFGKTAYEWAMEEHHISLRLAATVISFVIGVLLVSRVVVFLYFNF